jgi:cytochrome P450
MTATTQGAEPYPFGPAEKLLLHPRLAELRANQPVARIRLPYGGEAWLVTRYEDVRTVLVDPRFSRSAIVGKDVPRVAPAIPDSNIVLMEGEEHARLRRLVTKAFGPRRIERLRIRIQEIVDDLLDKMIANGQPADIANAVCWPMAITVICELLGVPEADRGQFREMSDKMGFFGATAEEAVEVAYRLLGYIGELVADHRKDPADDVLGDLVLAQEDGESLTDHELGSLAATLLIAGYDATAAQATNSVYALMSDRDLWDRLVAEPDVIPPAVEELLRALPQRATAALPQLATEDVELGGQLIRAGEAVIIDSASANKDASAFVDPEVINFDRERNQHLALGHGAHHCLGAHLGRAELQILISTLTRRLPRMRLAIPAEDLPWRNGQPNRGVEELPVVW